MTERRYALKATPRPPVATRAMYPERIALAPRSKNASTARTRTSPSERPGDQEAERGDARGGGQPEQDLARAADVAEMTERDLTEQGDRRGDGQGRADLGRRQSDDVREVRGRTSS